MAPPCYEVRQTPGKGRGMFATRLIRQGEVILRDLKILSIDKEPHLVQQQDVDAAFQKLSKHDQAQVMELAAFQKPGVHASRLMHILSTNSFGDGEGACLYPIISRVNHACVPNATKNRDTLVAEADISQDEEICITYNTDKYECMTVKQRAIVMQSDYGFKCACKACQDGKSTAVSDARRQIISHLRSSLEGFQAPDLRSIEAMNDAEVYHMQWPLPRTPLRKLLTKTQKIEYTFLLAALRQAEGISSFFVGKAYMDAAWQLFQHLEDYVLEYPSIQDIVFLEPPRCVKAWMREGLNMFSRAVRPDSSDLAIARENWEEMRQSELMKFVDDPQLSRIFSSSAFAVQLATPVGALRPKVFLSSEECEKLIRQRERLL